MEMDSIVDMERLSSGDENVTPPQNRPVGTLLQVA